MPQPNLNSVNYYEILGCARNADDAALKKAYRKLAVKWHPDKNSDNEEATKNFQKISEAYASLKDPQKRKLYDQYGKQGADTADQMPGGDDNAGGFNFNGEGGFPSGSHFHGGISPEDANRMFSEFFGSSDPFGGFGGGSSTMFHGGGIGGMPGMSGASFSNASMGGGGIGGIPGMSSAGDAGGIDPFSMMFNGGGMPAGVSQQQRHMFNGGGMPTGVSSSFQQQQHQKQYNIIPHGTVVSLKGLVNAPDRNGDKGTIQQYNAQTGRYIINLIEEDSLVEDNDVKTMSVKASNIQQHVQVKIHDIQNQVELNETTGTIISWISGKGRYNIYISSLKRFVSLKPGNIVLTNGIVAQIHGLLSKPELNGTFGTIKEWIRNTNKYDVQLSAQQVIRVKVENMQV